MIHAIVLLIGFIFAPLAYSSRCVDVSCFKTRIKDNVLDLPNSEISRHQLPDLIKFIKAHPEIDTVNLSYSTFCFEEQPCWKPIGNAGALALSECKNLRGIDLSGADISDEGAKVLTNNPRLTYIKLANNFIGDEGISSIASLAGLEYLNIDWNPLVTNKGIQVLAKHSNLKHLSFNSYMAHYNVTDEAMDELAQNTSITYLDLSGKQITERGAKLLSENKTLLTLNLYGNQINDAGARALLTMANLKHLNLGANILGTALDEALASTTIAALILDANYLPESAVRALASNQNIRTLSLRNCQISNDAVISLTYAPLLSDLDVSGNYVLSSGKEALAASKFITKLKLDFLNISDDEVSLFASNPIFISLSFMSNHITDHGAKKLAGNTTIKDLFLFQNQIGDEGALAFAANATLRLLDISYNVIGEIGINALAANPTLETLIMLPQSSVTLARQ
jgi:Leucine-rich repeat (LRR) protein